MRSFSTGAIRMSKSTKSEKLALRKRIKAILSQIESSEIEEQSRIVTEKVLRLPAYENAKAISIFLSMPGREVSTTGIVLDALRNDKKVFIPYIYAPKDNPKLKTMDMLRLKDEADLKNLKGDAWGIPSIAAEDVEHRENALGGHGISTSNSDHRPDISLIFMPGMAFDKLNNRLGHGRGFYDRYLARIQHAGSGSDGPTPHLNLVGLGLREQLLAEDEAVPVDENDWPIDELIVAD